MKTGLLFLFLAALPSAADAVALSCQTYRLEKQISWALLSRPACEVYTCVSCPVGFGRFSTKCVYQYSYGGPCDNLGVSPLVSTAVDSK